MSPSTRPTKRTRTSTAETPASTSRSSDDMELQQQQHGTASRARGPAACERCRDRKTKCDFQRPVCGYCTKRQVSCVYPEDAVKWVESLSREFGSWLMM